MQVTPYEIVLEDVLFFNNCIYTDLVTSSELFVLFCRNFYMVRPVSELPLGALPSFVPETVIAHNPDHSFGNIGHYFNDHLYSFVECSLRYKEAKVLFCTRWTSHFMREDIVNTKGCFAWGMSVFRALKLELLNIKDDVVYQFKRLILPREDRFFNRNIACEVDPLLHISSCVQEYVSPNLRPYDVLFFNKKSDRNIFNDTEVIQWIEHQKLSYIIIEDISVLSFMEVITLFNNANTLISPWGSHLTNSFFMRSGSTVYELHPKNMRDAWWERMGIVLNSRCKINYRSVACNSIESADRVREKTSVIVDVKDINIKSTTLTTN